MCHLKWPTPRNGHPRFRILANSPGPTGVSTTRAFFKLNEMRKNGNNLILSDFPGEKDPLTDAATDTRGGYLTAMRMGSIVAEARKHLGMVEQPSKRMFYAILPPFPSTSHSSSFELHALSSQVANLSVIILKAKET